MVTDLELRRAGIGAGKPAVRKLLALTLGECSAAAVEWLVAQAAREAGVDGAAALATRRLQDGSWRELWAGEQSRRTAAAADAMPRERLEAMAAIRVIADRRTIDEVAAELALDRDRVRELVLRGAVARGMTDEQVGELFGVPTSSRDRRAEAFRAARRRDAAATDTAPAAATATAPRPTLEAIAGLYRKVGRRAPAHVLETLTKEPQR